MKHTKQRIVLLGIFLFLIGSNLAINQANGYGYPSETLIVGPKTALVPYWEYLDDFSLQGDMAIGPTGTVSIVYSGTWEEGHNVYYIDNATGSWSEPELLIDPTYVNHQANDIYVDNESDVHIYSHGATFVNYITNKTADGSWYQRGVGGAQLSFGIMGNPSGSKIYMINYDDDGLVYTNLTLAEFADEEDPDSVNHTSYIINYDESDPLHYVFFPKMAVDSTGMAHIVFQVNNSIYYMTISPSGIKSSPRLIAEKSPIYGSKCEYPNIKIDSTDKIHFIYNQIYQLANGSWDRENSGLYYDVINTTTDGSDAYKIGPISNYPEMTLDTDDNVLVFSVVTENELQQIVYTTDRSGGWVSDTLTDFSYSVYAQGEGNHEICVNPVTNDVLLLTSYKGRMELIQTINGEWGHEVEYTITLSAFNTRYPNNVIVSMEMKNLSPGTYNFEIEAGIESDGGPEYVNTGGQNQTIGNLAVDTTVNKSWEMHYPGAYEGQIHVGLLIDPNLDDRCYFGAYYDVIIDTSLNIPGPSFSLILLGVGIGIIFVIKQKR